MDSIVIASKPLSPDYQWVPADLRDLAGGWLAVCLVVAVGALGYGVFRWAASKATAAQWDDVHGQMVLAAVIVGALVLGAIPSLAQTGMSNWGSEPTQQVQQYNGASGKPDDEGKGILSKIKEGAGKLGDLATSVKEGIKEGIKSLGSKAGEWFKNLPDTFTKAIDSLNDAWSNSWLGRHVNGAAQWVGDTASDAKQLFDDVWSQAQQKFGDAKQWAGDKANEAKKWISDHLPW